MRCFIAIDLPKDVKTEIARLQKELPDAKMNLVKLDNVHFNMKFLGELNQPEIDKVRAALERLKFPKFSAKLSGLGVFPEPTFIRVVWAGVDPKDKFIQLHDALENELAKEGFRKDSVFENHATLARIKFIKEKKWFVDELSKIKFHPVEFSVKSIILKKSTLTPEGPVYDSLMEVRLQ